MDAADGLVNFIHVVCILMKKITSWNSPVWDLKKKGLMEYTSVLVDVSKSSFSTIILGIRISTLLLGVYRKKQEIKI